MNDRTPGNHHRDWDVELVPEAAEEDLDQNAVAKILEGQRRLQPSVFGRLSDEKALRALRLVGADGQGVLRPTLAGLLAAGIFPQEFFPKLGVTFTVYPGKTKVGLENGVRFIDNASFVGSIPELVDQTVQAVSRNMRTGGLIDGAFRQDLPDYPPVAVREAVTNALMHRDYSPQSRTAQVEVNMYADRLEVVNPGGLYGPVTRDSLGHYGVTGSRNQFLSRILEVTPRSTTADQGFVAENRGTGYAEILHQLEQKHLPPPGVKDSLTSFRLIFWRRGSDEAKRRTAQGREHENVIERYLEANLSAPVGELATASGLSKSGVRRVLNHMIDIGIIERTEPLRSPKQRYRL